MTEENNIGLEPEVKEEHVFEGRAFEDTPPGIYKMALKTKNMRIRKTKNGDKKLEFFLSHTDPEAKKLYKGVNGFAMLSGVDKSGKPMKRQLAQVLVACGIPKESVFVEGKFNPRLVAIELDDLESADWKGVPAMIQLDGEPLDLNDREMTVKVTPYTYEGVTKVRASGYYPVS